MSVYKTTMSIDLTNCEKCPANSADVCGPCDLSEVECEIVCDVEPYRPARLTADPDGSSPAEGGVSIEDIIRTDTKESVYTEDLVDKIIDRVAENYADSIADRGD